MLRIAAAFFAISLLSGCASIDEAFGVPDATEWSYFQASAGAVAVAARDALRQGGLRVERINQTTEGGYVLDVSTQTGSAAFEQIYVQPFAYESFESRAQTFPQGRRLPEDIRVAIASEL
ncbi:MAG: hypothetical protein AAF791_11425 [Bacteroidota bacterium]